MGQLYQTWFGRQVAEHSFGPDHADPGLACFGEDGDPAGQGHGQLHVLAQYVGCLLGIAHFKYLALLGEVDTFAAQAVTEIKYCQHAESVRCHSGLKIGTCLIECFSRINNNLWIHGIWVPHKDSDTTPADQAEYNRYHCDHE